MRVHWCTILALLASTSGLPADDSVDYLRDVKPLLRERCYACHGQLKQQSKLRLDTAASALKGGDAGPAVVAGRVDESPLIERVTAADPAQRMPPEGAPLSAAQVAMLKAWIAQGAKAPADEKPQADPREHWAFRGLLRPAVPQTAWGRNPVDSFIAAGQTARGTSPRPEADRAELLRRVTLDLTGLPPTRGELHAFLDDPREDAYERLVDRLLDSPQHGERWARHWMDVWRYSDWYGRRAVPDVWNSAPQIWRWRDWIVASLNRDRGYDRMVQEMLAADEIRPGDDEAAVATGYLIRNWYALNPNQWMRDNVEHTGKAFLGLTFNCCHCHDHKYDPISQEEYFRFRAFFEPINIRQDRWAGEPDPGPFQKYDYAVLRKIQPLGFVQIYDERPDEPTHMYVGGDERVRMNRPPVAPAAPAFLGGERLEIKPFELPAVSYYPGLKPFFRKAVLEDAEAGLKTAAEAHSLARTEWQKAESLWTAADAQYREATTAVAIAALKLPQDVPPGQAGFVDQQRTADGQRSQALKVFNPARLNWLAAESRLAFATAFLGSVKGRLAADDARYLTRSTNADDLARLAAAAERLAVLRQAEDQLAQHDAALAAAELKGDANAIKQAQTQRDAARPAVEGAKKTLALTDGKYTPFSPQYSTKTTGRRRALAEWITSRSNPLTARVAVNHIWLRHFGRALVRTVNDFGQNGARPSHPELLDWLAVEFMESGWSMKHVHRLIVTSAAYRQDSSTPAADASRDRDPDNLTYWRFPSHRLETEGIRDSILAVSEQLDRTLGGAPLDNAKDTGALRRSLYFSVYPEDGGHPLFQSLFDPPDPCDCYQRTESLVPQQALALTNSDLLLKQSQLLTAKLSAEALDSDAAFATAAFEQVLTRRPTDAELSACLAFLAANRPATAATATGDVALASLKARESLVRALFSHDDFVTIR